MQPLWQVFATFFEIGLFSIGGGYAIIPMIQERVVEKHAWISQQTFADIITVSQMTPGPLAVNASTFVGIQVGGIFGGVLATLACIVSGVSISIFLYFMFQKYGRSAYVIEVLNGLKAASLGLIAAAAATILLITFTGAIEPTTDIEVNWIAVAIFSVAMLAVRKWKVNPILLMAVAGVIGGLL